MMEAAQSLVMVKPEQRWTADPIQQQPNLPLSRTDGSDTSSSSSPVQAAPAMAYHFIQVPDTYLQSIAKDYSEHFPPRQVAFPTQCPPEPEKNDPGRTAYIQLTNANEKPVVEKVDVTIQTSGTPLKQFVCGECGKGFTTNSGLQYHHRTHTGERPYSCAACGKSFMARSGLRYHTRTHSGEKPYACGLCGKTFTAGNGLKYHMTKTHGAPTGPVIRTGTKPGKRGRRSAAAIAADNAQMMELAGGLAFVKNIINMGAVAQPASNILV